jgi:hypothetical protein
MVNNPNKCDDVDEDDQPRGTKRVRKKVTVMSNLLSPPPLPSPQIKRKLRFEGGKNHRQSALLPKKTNLPCSFSEPVLLLD